MGTNFNERDDKKRLLAMQQGVEKKSYNAAFLASILISLTDTSANNPKPVCLILRQKTHTPSVRV